MNELHENLFKLLIELDSICKEHDIDYCLAGGTALGAIRNHCFLPWDDDIDLYITRDNWIKLRDLIEQNPQILPKNRNFVCIENTPLHRNPIARYVDTNTTIIYPAQSISAKTCGNQIELFILDPIPNVKDGQEEHLKQMRVFLEVLSPYFITSKNISLQDYDEHKQLVFKYYDEIEKRGYDEVMKELYNKLYTYPSEKADTLCLRWGTRTLLHKSKFYSQKRYEELEGHKFPVAYELEHALRVDYGDSWMYIPSREGQLFHNPLVDDPNRPFEDFTNIYLNHIDQNEVVRAYEKNKIVNINLWIPKREIELEKRKLKGIIAKKEIINCIDENNLDLKQILDDNDFKILNNLFDNYYSIQLDKSCKKYNLLIDIDDDLLKIAIMSKIKQGLYYTARNILNIVEHNTSLDSVLQHYKDICEYCRKLSIGIYDDNDVKLVEDTLNNLPEDCDSLIDTYRATLWLLIKKANNSKDYLAIIEKGEKMLIEYPEDGELMAYIAEAYYQLNDEINAIKMYDNAVHHTRNGFVWQNAKKHVGIDRMSEEDIHVN